MAAWAGDGVPLPDPGWVWVSVVVVPGTEDFSGLLFYPWTRPRWAERAIKDVLPAYEAVFRRAFSP